MVSAPTSILFVCKDHFSEASDRRMPVLLVNGHGEIGLGVKKGSGSSPNELT